MKKEVQKGNLLSMDINTNKQKNVTLIFRCENVIILLWFLKGETLREGSEGQKNSVEVVLCNDQFVIFCLDSKFKTSNHGQPLEN